MSQILHFSKNEKYSKFWVEDHLKSIWNRGMCNFIACFIFGSLIQSISRSAGALGSRLTGAGWGGCTVSMVPSSLLHDFLHKVQFEYYSKDPAKLAVIDHSLFATSPGGGAAIVTSEAIKN